MTNINIQKARELIEWLISLDDPDPESQGFNDRRTVTLNQIINRAKDATAKE